MNSFSLVFFDATFVMSLVKGGIAKGRAAQRANHPEIS